jgi:hypothetical protein
LQKRWIKKKVGKKWGKKNKKESDIGSREREKTLLGAKRTR